MMTILKYQLFTLQVLLLVLLTATIAPAQVLPFDGSAGGMESTLNRVNIQIVAEQDTVKAGDESTFAIILDIEEGWHLNAHNPGPEYLIGVNLKMEANDALLVSDVQYPPSEPYDFGFSDEIINVYEGEAIVLLKLMSSTALEAGQHDIIGQLNLQACSDSVCLAPASVQLTFSMIAGNETVLSKHEDLFQNLENREGVIDPASEQNHIAAMFTEYGLFWAFGGIFLIGLALNLTPCVYPMMSVTVSLFAGNEQNQGPKLKQRFIGALFYVAGIVFMYSILGVIAAFTGSLFGSWLQSPAVLAGIGILLILLSLSMFGLYELQPPSWLMQKMGKTQQIAGNTGFFLSGLMVGIFAAPCIGPPIIALLAFVGSHGSPLFGFFAFFVMAVGLGLPYLVLGTFSGILHKLPQSGSWMVWIKKMFGVILVGVALFYLSLAFYPAYSFHVIIATIIVGGIYLGFIEQSGKDKNHFKWIKKATGIAALAIGLMMIQNLQKESVSWEEYDAAKVEESLQNGTPVMLDFYADWCIPCLELDRRTFTDGNVIRETESFVRMKIDLTHFDTEESEEIRRKYNIAGVPTILFLDSAGNEVEGARVVGFENPGSFLKKVNMVQ